MRKATYHVPKASGDTEDAELAVFYFGHDQGGGVEDNIQRWLGQFPETPPERAKREERTAHGMKEWVVESEGTFTGMGMPGTPSTPKKNFALIGAIVETPVGSYFFKLTGPRATVHGARDTFFGLLDSITL